MKQKRINDILYVFDITPYQITEDTNANVIKVQQEVVAGFKELNESLANKIVAYNYHVLCTNTPEWAPYVDQDDSLPIEPVAGHTFTLTGNNIEDKLGVNFDDVPQEMLYEWPDVTQGTMIEIYNTFGASDAYETELPKNSNGNWYVEMPEDDLTVTVNYIGSGGGESGASGAS
jgi:hypothetical protein